MTIHDLLEREHATIAGLLEKLGDTGDGAVKTRERLVAQLKARLEAHVAAVQEHLYPLLRKSEDIRALIPELAERNEIKRQLAELERTPKDDEGFLPKIKELKKIVEPHLRAEAKRIVPALKKALGAEEADELAKRLAAAMRETLNDAQQSDDDIATETAETTAAAAQRSAAIVSLGAQRALEEAGETAQEATKAAAVSSRRLVESAAERTQQAGRSALQAADIYTETSQRVTEDLRALAAAPSTAAGTLQELQRAWTEWLGQVARTNTRAAQALWRCTTPQQVAEVHRELLTEGWRAWLEGGARVLRTVRHASDAARRPVEERLEQTRPGEDQRGGNRRPRAV